eukprot:COSAG01_NODE_15928_length_1285_cov_5.267285_2_plen_70_part_00
MASGVALVHNFTEPCPALKKTVDCRAIWVAWGECQADSQQIMRYTIEERPMNGGTACAHADGFAQKFPC